MVSSSVRPVKTRMVSVFSCSVSVAHDWTSLETGTFSGSQKLPTRRSQTSASLSSSSRFQLIAETRLTSLSFSLIGVLPSCRSGSGEGSEHARDATLDLGALQRELAEADVVDRLDALAPGVDLRLVQVTRGGRVLEEQGQRQSLVDVLRGLGVGVDDLLVADLV